MPLLFAMQEMNVWVIVKWNVAIVMVTVTVDLHLVVIIACVTKATTMAKNVGTKTNVHIVRVSIMARAEIPLGLFRANAQWDILENTANRMLKNVRLIHVKVEYVATHLDHTTVNVRCDGKVRIVRKTSTSAYSHLVDHMGVATIQMDHTFAPVTLDIGVVNVRMKLTNACRILALMALA